MGVTWSLILTWLGSHAVEVEEVSGVVENGLNTVEGRGVVRL